MQGLSEKRITDQMGFEVLLPANPQRIVSLVPSQTELLYDLGMADRIVGVTKFCVHPKLKPGNPTIIGGTKNFKPDKIRQLNPDLIIGNKEENIKSGIIKLQQEFPVWMSDISNRPEAIKMIYEISRLVNEQEKANAIIEKIEDEFSQLALRRPKRVLYFIWKNPYMVAGENNFINAMLSELGWVNVTGQHGYPELTPEEITKINPELILLSSEPYPFQDKHIEQFKSICPDANIQIVDGEMFSWYGSRMKYAPVYFNSLVC